MPLLLVIVMALIQDVPFRDFTENKITMILVDNDKEELSAQIYEGLHESKLFSIFQIPDSVIEKERILQNEVKQGNYSIGVIIPQESSERLRSNVKLFVRSVLSGDSAWVSDSILFDIYVDPTTKKSFKNTLFSHLREFSKELEFSYMLQTLGEEMKDVLPNSENLSHKKQSIISFKEKIIDSQTKEIIPINSTQHNVPAWIMFAMFFIVVPMASNIIKEREQGVYYRLMTLPNSIYLSVVGKIVPYLVICFLQFLLIISIGRWFFPYLGLPVFSVSHSLFLVMLAVLSCACCATGFGLFTAYYFKTHQQASTFGAVSVIILAALGGVWVPVSIMPDSLVFLSNFSPLRWGLDMFNTIFLRQGSFYDIQYYILKLGILTVAFYATVMVKSKRMYTYSYTILILNLL